MWMGITRAALGWCLITKPSSWTSQRRTTVQHQAAHKRTQNGHCYTVPQRPMVWPVYSRLTTTGWCTLLSMMTRSSKSSGTSDIKDMCQSPARSPAKLHCCAFCKAGGTMSWKSVTLSMVLEEIWPELPEKLFADLKHGLKMLRWGKAIWPNVKMSQKSLSFLLLVDQQGYVVLVCQH